MSSPKFNGETMSVVRVQLEIKRLSNQGRHAGKIRTNLSDLGRTKANPDTGSLKSRHKTKVNADQDEVVHRVG